MLTVSNFFAMSHDEKNEVFETIEQNILALPNMQVDDDVSILFEDAGNNTKCFMKFMSDKGKYDAANGITLKSFLDSRKVVYDSTADRNVILNMSDVLKLFS